MSWVRATVEAAKLLAKGGTTKAIGRYQHFSTMAKNFGVPYKGLEKVGLAQRSVKTGFRSAWRGLDPAQQTLLKNAGALSAAGGAGVAVGTQL